MKKSIFIIIIQFLLLYNTKAQSIGIRTEAQSYRSYFDIKTDKVFSATENDPILVFDFTFPIKKIDVNLGFFKATPFTGYSFRYPNVDFYGQFISSVFCVSAFGGLGYHYYIKPRISVGIMANVHAVYTRKSLLINSQATRTTYTDFTTSMVNKGWQYIPEIETNIVFDFKKKKKWAFMMGAGYMFGQKRMETLTVDYNIFNFPTERVQVYNNGTNFNVNIGLRYKFLKKKDSKVSK